MTWTYTNDPANVALDEVRFLIGDTDTNDQQLTDEELNYLISDAGNNLAAAVLAAQNLQALYARQVDKSVGDLRISYSQRAAHYAQLVKTLERRRATRSGGLKAGGTSVSRKETVRDDTDRTRPSFARDQFRYPGTDDQEEDLDDLELD